MKLLKLAVVSVGLLLTGCSKKDLVELNDTGSTNSLILPENVDIENYDSTKYLIDSKAKEATKALTDEELNPFK